MSRDRRDAQTPPEGTPVQRQLSFEARLSVTPAAVGVAEPATAPAAKRHVPAVPAPVAKPAGGESAAPIQADLDRALPPQGQAPAVSAPPEPRVYTVGELVRGARVMLESRFADVRVEGEISGLKPSGPGHLYFTLKEAQAQVDCVMFSREAGRLKFRPRDGMQVRCRGRLTIYEGRGKFQMSIVDIEPAGAGALALAFEQLKQRLAEEGLFEASRKRPLPFLPRRVGVVTSPTGAVIRDILHVAHRRYPMPVLLAPTPVQGEGAAAQIVMALERLARVPDVDVIIIARGGGSLEDLWCFNEESVARAIARCRVPVVSAVGHETDFTIADFVADRRAPTPSAAAEIVVPERRALCEELANLQRRLHRHADSELHRARLTLERLRTRLGDPRRLVDRQRQALDDAEARLLACTQAAVARRRSQLRELERRLLRAHPQKRIAEQRAALMALERKLASNIKLSITKRQHSLHRLHAKIEAMSPLQVLNRGYSLVRTLDGHVVARHGAVVPGQMVQVMLCEGEFTAEVKSTHAKAEAETAGDGVHEEKLP